MKIILTNDDGIEAPGLQSLWQSVHDALADQSLEIIVVAPDRGRSECSHSVTQSRPLVIKSVKPQWYSVDGTPVDCVRVATHTLIQSPTMVLSGINQGANLGVNLTVSGTFAAAREAAMTGIPAMAISQYRRPDVPKTWEHCSDWLSSTLIEFALIAQQIPLASQRSRPLWNVNLPAIENSPTVPPIRRCAVDPCPIPRTATTKEGEVSFELDFHGRPRHEGTDVDLCFNGQITISEVSPFIN
jgi:5'-nucleotidase